MTGGPEANEGKNEMHVTKVKTLNSHSGLSRFLAECDDEGLGYLPRCHVAHIPSPYAYSPTKDVESWNGKRVVWFETRHRHYEVYELPADAKVFATDAEAEEFNFQFNRVNV